MPLPSSALVELLPDPDVAAASLAARSDDPRLVAALAGILAADGVEHPFDGFVASAAERLDGLGADLGDAVAEVDAAESGPGTTPFVIRVVGAAQRFSRLTTRLTEYAAACAPAVPEATDPRDLVAAALARLAEEGMLAPVDVSVRGPALPLDPDHGCLMLQHLLANAAAYAPGPVTVSTRREGESWEVVVADRGPGIPTADRARVLQPLVRLDRDRAVPGDGLGLAIVGRAVRAHGGRIFVNRASATGGTALRLVRGLR